MYCPCEATVIEVVDGIEDNIPFNGKYPYNVGNRVVLKIDNFYIVIGHLEKDSITVTEGDKVKSGQGKSIPIFFNDLYYPFKNMIIKG